MESVSLSSEGPIQGGDTIRVFRKFQQIKELSGQRHKQPHQRSTCLRSKDTDSNLQRLNTIDEELSFESSCALSDDDINTVNIEVINADDHTYDEEIENSFEKSSIAAINFDDLPVTNIVQGGKTFEQVIEDQLKKEQQQLASVNRLPTPKKKFLRKGQGTARFNGPPTKVTSRKPTKTPCDGKTTCCATPKPLKVEQQGQMISVVENKTLLTTDNNVALPANKLPIRKTARLNRREPLKQQYVLSDDTSITGNCENLGRPVVKLIPGVYRTDSVIDIAQREQEQTTSVPESATQDYNDEEEWSDPTDDTILTLDTTEVENLLTEPTDPYQSSNDTFERLERYCNKNFDVGDAANFNLDDAPNLRCKANDEQQQLTTNKPSNSLMQKLFPPLKPTAPTIIKQQVEFRPEFYTDSDQPKPEFGSILKSKLEELQTEIKLFRRENAAMMKRKTEYENGMKELEKQGEEFQKFTQQQLKDIEQYRKTERAKLRKSRRTFEDYVNTTKKNLPDKNDKDAIREIQEELGQVRAEAKLKEQRLSAINSRLRTQVDMLSCENSELKSRVQSLEEENIKLTREGERRKAQELARRWREVNEIVNTTSSNPSPKVEIAECKLPLARYIAPTSSSISTGKTNRNPSSASAVTKARDIQQEQSSTIEVTVRNKIQSVPETYYDDARRARCTTQADGVKVIEFVDDQQVERHFTDGSKHIKFPDGSALLTRPDGYRERTLRDGSCMRAYANGDRVADFPNGEREIHAKDFKRREYPDGTSKTIYSDGRQETKYASGRVRVKDPTGRVVVDTYIDLGT